MNSRLRLSFASAVNERTRPLLDGTVRPEGIDLIPIVLDPSETFWRMLRFGEFDVTEMSLSSFLIARERGFDALAIPAFPSRRFMHIELIAHVDSGITGPADLAGKKLGVGEYQQTAAVWTRGILEHDFGVPATSIHWHMERSPEESHGAATGFEPPEGIRFSRIPKEASMATMLASGELDAALVKRAMRKGGGAMVERSARLKVDPEELARVTRPVFPDPIAEGARFVAAHGFVPVNHTYVIRGELLRQHPWVALEVYKAMVAAKQLAERRPLDAIPLSLIFREHYLEMTREAVGADPFPYGYPRNREALETLAAWSHQQGLTAAPADPAALFAPNALEWSRLGDSPSL